MVQSSFLLIQCQWNRWRRSSDDGDALKKHEKPLRKRRYFGIELPMDNQVGVCVAERQNDVDASKQRYRQQCELVPDLGHDEPRKGGHIQASSKSNTATAPQKEDCLVFSRSTRAPNKADYFCSISSNFATRCRTARVEFV